LALYSNTQAITPMFYGSNGPAPVLGLVAMHTLWMRQHNRVARQLADINPHWNDEQLFQVKMEVVTKQHVFEVQRKLE
jgi:hypothetical protein